MIRTRRNGLFGTGLLAMLGAVAMVAPAGAIAQDAYESGLVPEELQTRFASCPDESAFSEGFHPLYCASIRASDGELKLGSVEARIEDELEVTIGIGLGPGFATEFVMPAAGGGEGGGSEPVKISGGILGIPELDPLIDAEPLGLLSLAATPEIGEIDAEAEGLTPTHLSRITLPLSIKLNNALFGDECQIGTPEEPFVVNLTTGTTEPPEGIEPMVGQAPVASGQHQWLNALTLDRDTYYETGTGAISVDNTFEVPAAKNCDLLPREAHGAVESINGSLKEALGADPGLNKVVGDEAGLFDPLINQQAGLPSPAGTNHMRLRVDTAWIGGIATADQSGDFVRFFQGEITPPWAGSPSSIDFGEVEVGQSSSETFTVENTGSEPLVLESGSDLVNFWTNGAANQFEIDDNGCASRTLAPGESCAIELRFTPTSIGSKRAVALQQTAGRIWLPQFFGPAGNVGVQVKGKGVALSSDAVDFGEVEVGQASDPQVIAFENTGSAERTITEPAALAGTSSRFSSWQITGDDCHGVTLAAGETCQVEVSFAPDSGGTKDVSLEIRGPGPAVIGSADLAGSGTEPLGGQAVEFGTVDVGQSSAVQTGMFENLGENAVEIDALALAGTTSRLSSWQLTDDGCSGQTLSPGDTCSVGAIFAPDSPFTKNVRIDAQSGSLRLGFIELNGSGLTPLTPEPATAAFGDVTVGSSSPAQTVVFEHTGSQPATLVDVALQGTSNRFASWQFDGIDCEGRTLDPGQTCAVEITLAPNTAGTKTVNLDVRGSGAIVLGRASLAGRGINP